MLRVPAGKPSLQAAVLGAHSLQHPSAWKSRPANTEPARWRLFGSSCNVISLLVEVHCCLTLLLPGYRRRDAHGLIYLILKCTSCWVPDSQGILQTNRDFHLFFNQLSQHETDQGWIQWLLINCLNGRREKRLMSSASFNLYREPP